MGAWEVTLRLRLRMWFSRRISPVGWPWRSGSGKETRRIIWQNITLAFGVKLIVLVLGAGGLATMWEAVFADVGVALLAILNAIRIQKRAR